MFHTLATTLSMTLESLFRMDQQNSKNDQLLRALLVLQSRMIPMELERRMEVKSEAQQEEEKRNAQNQQPRTGSTSDSKLHCHMEHGLPARKDQ